MNPRGVWCLCNLHCFGNEVIYLLTYLLIQVINFEKVTFFTILSKICLLISYFSNLRNKEKPQVCYLYACINIENED